MMFQFSSMTLLAMLLRKSLALPEGPLNKTCTSTVFDLVADGCTKHVSTETDMSPIDCSGCVLVTKHLGPGVACPTVTEVSDTKTTTIVVCA